MLFRVPTELHPLGVIRETAFNGPFLSLSPEVQDTLVGNLEQLGYEINEDGELVRGALAASLF